MYNLLRRLSSLGRSTSVREIERKGSGRNVSTCKVRDLMLGAAAIRDE